jgi:hypothetical protein
VRIAVGDGGSLGTADGSVRASAHSRVNAIPGSWIVQDIGPLDSQPLDEEALLEIEFVAVAAISQEPGEALADPQVAETCLAYVGVDVTSEIDKVSRRVRVDKSLLISYLTVGCGTWYDYYDSRFVV